MKRDDKKFLESDRLLFRALEPTDLERLYEWENDSSFWNTGNTLAPYSHYALKNYIEEAQKGLYECGQLRLMIERKEDGMVVGAMDLYNLEAHIRKAEIGLFVAPEYQGMGYAKEALKQLQTYAFRFLRLHQLYAYIAVDNEACVSLHTDCGFQVSGTLRDWAFGVEEYTDVHVLQIINKGTV